MHQPCFVSPAFVKVSKVAKYSHVSTLYKDSLYHNYIGWVVRYSEEYLTTHPTSCAYCVMFNISVSHHFAFVNIEGTGGRMADRTALQVVITCINSMINLHIVYAAIFPLRRALMHIAILTH